MGREGRALAERRYSAETHYESMMPLLRGLR